MLNKWSNLRKSVRDLGSAAAVRINELGEMLDEIPDEWEQRIDNDGEPYFVDTKTGEWYRIDGPLRTRIDTNEKISIISDKQKKEMEDLQGDLDEHESCGSIFRITHLSKVFMAGFTRLFSDSAQHTPDGIQMQMIKYVNWYFVRLKYDIYGNETNFCSWRPSVVAVENTMKGSTLRSIALMLEKMLLPDLHPETQWKSITDARAIRLCMRFEFLRYIYPIDKSTTNEKVGCSMEEIMAMETDLSRWVEVPDDYLGWGLGNIDTMIAESDSDGIMEIGVGCIQAPWIGLIGWDLWIQQLKIGDIIDVKDDQDKWYEAVIRYTDNSDDERKLIVHYIGWNLKYDTVVLANDEHRIRKRGIKTNGPHRPRKNRAFIKPRSYYLESLQ